MTDYSKSSIYKIACKDPNIEEIYIGSTCNLVKRRYHHKYRCNNINGKSYNLYVYRFIRSNGGWSNFDLYVIEEFSCNTKIQKDQVERGYIESLKPTLNKNVPANYQTGDVYSESEYKKQYYEHNRDHITKYQKAYQKHNKDAIVENKKRYYDQNKETIGKQQRVYKKLYQQKTIHCPQCAHMINLVNRSRHNKTQKHIANSESSSSEPDTVMDEMNKLHDDNVLKLQEIQNTFDKIDKIIR